MKYTLKIPLPHFIRFRTLLPAFFGALLVAATGSASAQDTPGNAKIAVAGTPDAFKLTYPSMEPVAISAAGNAVFVHTFLFGISQIYQGSPAAVKVSVHQGSPVPNGSTYGVFGDIDCNAAGQFAVTGSRPWLDQNYNGMNLFLYSGNTGRLVSENGRPAAGDGNFKDVSSGISISEAGQVAFHSQTTVSGEGIFLATPTGTSKTTPAGIQKIAKLGDSSLDGGNFTDLDTGVAVSTPGTGDQTVVAFTGQTSGTLGSGLYLGTATQLKLVAGGYHSDFKMNNHGAVVFRDDDGNIKKGTTSGTATLVARNSTVADLGTFVALSNPVVNDNGEIAFNAYVDHVGNGVFLWSGGSIKKIAVDGDSAQGVIGTVSSFGAPHLNNSGQVAFTATVNNGGMNRRAILLGSESDLVKTIAEGDTLLGSPVESFNFPAPSRLVGHGALNDSGQLCYTVWTASSHNAVFVFTPTLHWRGGATGSWDLAANWTFHGKPGAGLDAFIDPAIDTVVDGPSSAESAHTLQIGGGAGVATLQLRPTGAITSAGGVTVKSNGVLGGAGTITGNVTLQGDAKVALNLGGKTRDGGAGYLKATGKMILAGTLEINTVPGFEPELGDVYDVLDFSSRTGTFTTIDLPALSSPALTWDVALTPAKFYSAGKITVVLANGWQGAYAGRIEAEAPAVESSGSILVTMQAAGGFRAKGKFGGKAFSVAGTLDAAGAFVSAAFDRAGHRLSLQLDLQNSPGHFTGSILDASSAIVAGITGDQTPVFADRAHPSPFAGAYTVALPADPAHPEATYPQGTGFGTLTVSARGVAKLVGVLGDGTAFSAGGTITAGGLFPLYIPLYGAKGFVGGTLALQGPTANDEVTGTLTWSKPATKTPKLFPEAFAGQIVIVGSGFQNSPAHPQILNFPAGATLTISGGNVGIIAAQAATIAAGNKVTLTPNANGKFKFAFVKSPVGRFSGAFPATVNSKTVSFTFKGVVLQKQNRAAGLFKGLGQTGVVEFR